MMVELGIYTVICMQLKEKVNQLPAASGLLCVGTVHARMRTRYNERISGYDDIDGTVV